MSLHVHEGSGETGSPQADQQAAEATNTTPVMDELPDPHTGLIKELRLSAQYEGDPLGAVIVSETAKLFAFADKYQTLLESALDHAESVADLKNIDFAIKRRLDVHRQCHMYGQLTTKIAAPKSRSKDSE